MRLIHIMGDSSWSGIGSVILDLADLGRQLGWEVDVLTTDIVTKRAIREHGVGVVDLDLIRREIRIVKDLKGLSDLYVFLRRSHYDIVHTHTSKGGFVGRLAATLAGVPLVIHTAHGFSFNEESGYLSRFMWSTMEKMAAHWCDRIVTVSEFHRVWALRMRIESAEKIMAIPNGIDAVRLWMARPREEVRNSWTAAPTDVILLSTGRLAAQKGLIYLLRALPRVLTESPLPVKVVLAGEGPLRSELESVCRELGVDRNVMFLGFRSDLGDLLNACDIFVMPSLYEGLSISLLEAMAAGKPVICTNIASNLEVTRSGAAALLVPPKDPEALADAILATVRGPGAAAARALVAKAIYSSYYTADRMIAKYRDLYETLGAAVV